MSLQEKQTKISITTNCLHYREYSTTHRSTFPSILGPIPDAFLEEVVFSLYNGKSPSLPNSGRVLEEVVFYIYNGKSPNLPNSGRVFAELKANNPKLYCIYAELKPNNLKLYALNLCRVKGKLPRKLLDLHRT